MLVTKLKIATVVVLIIVALSGAAGLIYQAQAAGHVAEKGSPPGFIPTPPPPPGFIPAKAPPPGFRLGPVAGQQENPFLNVDFPLKKPVITVKPAVQSDPGIAAYSGGEDDRGSLQFDVRLTLNEKENKLADLQNGIPLAPPYFLDRVSEVTVDGVLKAVKSTKNTTTLEVTVATLGGPEKVSVEGVLLAKEIKVVIDGKPGKLADLKGGMPISMRVAKATDQAVIAEIRAGKAVESLQPKRD